MLETSSSFQKPYPTRLHWNLKKIKNKKNPHFPPHFPIKFYLGRNEYDKSCAFILFFLTSEVSLAYAMMHPASSQVQQQQTKSCFPLHSQTNGSNFLFLLFFGSAFLAHTVSPSSLAPPPFPVLWRKSPVLLPPLLSRASQLFKCVMGSGVLITFDQQLEKVNLYNITKVSLLWQGAALMLLILESLQITDQN